MTTARRAARAATTPEAPSGDADVMRVLREPAAAVWHDPQRFRAFMAGHGWVLPVPERLGGSSHPENRRSAAAAAWAVENGVESHPGHADWRQLRALGLIG